MIYVKEVVRDGDETDVIVTDGEHECLAFCHSCKISKEDELPEGLNVFEVDSVCTSSAQAASIIPLPHMSDYGHHAIADVVYVETGEVAVGGFRLFIFKLPGDVVADDRVGFTAQRFDVR